MPNNTANSSEPADLLKALECLRDANEGLHFNRKNDDEPWLVEVHADIVCALDFLRSFMRRGAERHVGDN